MLENVPVVKRYRLLRLISAIYKVIAMIVLAVGIVQGAVLFLSSTSERSLLGLGIAGLYVVGGAFAALWPYAVARVIDLLLETNNHTRTLAEAMQEQNELLKKIYKRQALVPPARSESLAERQARLVPQNDN